MLRGWSLPAKDNKEDDPCDDVDVPKQPTPHEFIWRTAKSKGCHSKTYQRVSTGLAGSNNHNLLHVTLNVKLNIWKAAFLYEPVALVFI